MKTVLSPRADKFLKYLIEKDLTEEECLMLKRGLEEYEVDPGSFIPLEKV